MIDDAWVCELERRAKPLRVALPPWGEVLAREALRAPPREPLPRSRPWKIAALALAAAVCAVWVWPRAAPHTPSPISTREHMTVATPIVVRAPTEITVSPSPEPVADTLASAPPEPTPRPREPRRPRRSTPRAHPRESMEVAPTVDCILDPRLCPSAKTAAPPTEELPETIGTAEIKRGLDGVRPQIRDCGRVHGAPPKQRVTIKISIAGESGTVTQANVVKPELAVDLEQCIVAALRRAVFPRFRNERLGAMFPVTMP